MSKAFPSPTVVTHIVSGDLWAGAEVQVYNLCKGLLASGTTMPTAVVFNEGLLSTRLRELGMNVDVADEKRLGPLRIIRAIKTHCKVNRSQVVHTHGFKENILGVIAKDLARVPRSIRTVHGNPETAFPIGQIHKLAIQKLDIMLGRFRQDHIIAVSSQLEESLNPVFPGKVEKIFNFIDVDAIRQKSNRKANRSRQNEPLKLGIVGRLVTVKRVDIFLDTLALLNEQGMEATGVVIGTGPLEQALKSYAREIGIDNLVEFKGFVDPVTDELCQLDALLMTSDHEGLPMTLLESLALEVPIIAHFTGGIPEILNYGECGWLVNEHSPAGYTRTVSQIFSRNKEIIEKTNSGLEHVKNLFGLNANIGKYLSLYQRHT